MNACDERGTTMRKRATAIVCLTLAALATSCTVYKIKELDAKALAGKGPKAKILSVRTKTGQVDFREKDPAGLKGGAIVGNVYEGYDIDPYDIAEVAPAGKRAKVVLKGGDRFQVLSSWKAGDILKCDVVRPTWIPFDEVVLARVRTVNAAASVLSTLGGVVLLVGALAFDAATLDEDEEIDPADTFTGGLVSSLVEDIAPTGGGSGGRRSNLALLGMKDASDTAGEEEFWILEWTRVSAEPGEDGKFRVRLENASGAPRGVDEAKLVVVDHAPGLVVAPDVRGGLGAFSDPVTPLTGTDGEGRDITGLVREKDGDFWRSPGGDSAMDLKARPRDEITLEFPRPKGVRRARLIVNVANSAWPAQFAREVRAASGGEAMGPKRAPVFREWEYSRLRVQILTVFGWQTGQVIFAGGPLPAADMIYGINLDDVATDKIWLKVAPPAGYWLIDRLALDFGEDVAVEGEEVEAEDVDSPDAAEVLRALAVEDGSTLFLESPGAQSALTFTAPPPKDGLERTLFLRTVSCYETPPPLASPPRRPGSPNRQTAVTGH